VLYFGYDDAGPYLSRGFSEHEWSEISHERSVCRFLGSGYQPSPSPMVWDGSVLPE